MRRSISLDGDWERRDFIDEAWRWSDALRGSVDGAAAGGPPVQAGVSAGWRPARVPGSAIDDAWRAGEIPNPYLDRNSLAAEWIPQRTWLYRRSFTLPLDGGPRTALRFEAIDPAATVFVDGEEVARHEGMFEPLEVDISDRVGPGGEHVLVVAVDAAPSMPSQVGRTDLACLPHSRMGYGWDFCPRMIHTGIWRSVTVDTYAARIVSTSVSVDVAADRGSARVGVVARIDGEAGDGLVTRIRAPDGSVVAERRTGLDGPEARIGLEIDGPELWWPNGLGEQALYSLELELHGGGPLDRRAIAFGVRTIEMRPTEGGTSTFGYTLVVNGRPTWARGWNWTPIDACFGVPRPEKLGHLIGLLKRANVNLVRVWGGGLLESDAFYDACDRAGIMVWQEFAQSSSGVANTPADDPEFVDRMRRHAEAIVPLRAHHPSLAIWCGGNELAWPDGRPLDDAHPVLAALREVVERLDPPRIWLPTSPTGPRFDNSLAAVEEDPSSLHDVHGPWEHQGLAEQHALANATTNLLHSEFGVEGMTNLASLRATVSDPDRHTADPTDAVMAHRGAWWNNRPFVERAFGGELSLEELERASQHLQADGLRTLIEGDRRRWPHNAGTLPWVFGEPFPNAWSNAAVDYFGVPKAAYFAVREAYAAVLPGLTLASQALSGGTRLTLTPWIVNDTDQPLEGPMTIALHDAFGRDLGSSGTSIRVGANSVALAAAVTLDLPTDANDLLVLDATFSEHTTRRLLSRTESLEPMRRLPPASLETAVDAGSDGWSVRLAVAGDVAAIEIRLDDARPVGWPERTAWAELDANQVTLLPGEERLVRVDWCDVPPDDRALRVSGWNVAQRVVADG